MLAAMSEENVETVRRLIEAWNSGDRHTARSTLDDDVVFMMPTIDASVSHGVEAMERSVEGWRRSWHDYSVTIEELIDRGNHVIALVRQRGRGRQSGVDANLTSAGLYTLRGGKVIRCEHFDTVEQALHAASLVE
jgi:ketosteroid isomerase-like protein